MTEWFARFAFNFFVILGILACVGALISLICLLTWVGGIIGFVFGLSIFVAALGASIMSGDDL